MDNERFGGEYPLTDEQVDFFRENGYVRCDDVLSAEEVAVLRRGVDRAIEERKGFVRDLAPEEKGEAKNARILQMLNLWEHTSEVEAYVFGGRLGRMAQRLAGGGEIRIYHDQALVKPPGSTAASPWHQDQPYWPSKEPGMFSCWMALDDVTVERGCMQFIPGSHHWGEFPPVSFAGDGTPILDQLTDEQRQAALAKAAVVRREPRLRRVVTDVALDDSAKAGLLLRVAPGIVLLPGADDLARDALAGLPQPFTASEARQRLGTSRRVVLPLLDHLDRTGRTRRLPDDRREVVTR